ncbi:MAG TPA: class I SAM-dependent rRNA methyltransferase [Dehalococcoidia bacterium]|nr:class I SAM-dependent rRNA methyltransferase [Dehalococcoidia bacterium]
MTRRAGPRPVTLKKDLARSIRQGHPWIYRDALLVREGLEDGALVEVRTRDERRVLARGFWDSASPIAVRILESGGPGHRFADADALLDQRLRAALVRRLAVLDLEKTNCFRWVHGEADLLPGLHADFYADTAVIRFDGEGARAFYDPIGDRLRHAAGSRLSIRSVLDRASRNRDSEAEEREVLEGGLRFIVDLAHAQKGGLFLDQRENRQRMAERAKGASVLNLFGYTGGFSLHAAAAGARSTDTVDVAAAAIETARRNFELNHLPLADARFHAVDAFEFLAAASERGERWDIVICDPPSFARSRDAAPAALAAYRRLHKLAASVTAPGGLLCAASCSSHVSKDDFLASIEAGAHQAGRKWELEACYGAAFDHPTLPAFPEGDYLKFAFGRCF